MAVVAHGQISFLLIAGAFLVASGFFALLRGGGTPDYIAAILLMVSGANIDVLTFSRYVTGISTGEIFSLFTIVAALSIMISLFALMIARAPARGDAQAGDPDKRGPQ